MATSGSLTTSKYDGRYYKLSWERTSTSVANNTSTIKWTLSALGGNSSWYAERTLKVVIAGTTVKDKTSRVERYTGEIDSGTLTIKHNTDGTKSFSASVKAAVVGSDVNCSGSDTFTLTAIPRASTVSATSATLGGSTTISISRKVSSYTHTLKYQFGDLTGTIVSKTTSTSYKWNIPSSFANEMKSVSSKNGAIICDTYSGSTLIGTETCGFTVKAGSGSYPTAEIDMYTTDTLSKNLTGSNQCIILGVSELYYTITATAQNGATIKSYKVSNGSQVKTTASGTFTDATSENIDYIVTDSRGLTYSGNIMFGDTSVIKYVKLTHSCTAKMTPQGVINFTVKGNFYNGKFSANNTNALALYFRVKELDGTYGSWTQMNGTISKSGNTYSYSGSASGLDYTKTYVFQTKAVDSIATVESKEKKLNSKPIFDWGEADFNFNVPIHVNDLEVVKTNTSTGSTYIGATPTADGNGICLRPNGVDSNVGQTFIDRTGDLSVNGNIEADNIGRTVYSTFGNVVTGKGILHSTNTHSVSLYHLKGLNLVYFRLYVNGLSAEQAASSSYITLCTLDSKFKPAYNTALNICSVKDTCALINADCQIRVIPRDGLGTGAVLYISGFYALSSQSELYQ